MKQINQNFNGNLIDLRGVSKIYHTDAGEFVALKDVDLKIGAGEFVSIVGKSGSGKTTDIMDKPSHMVR